MNQNYANAEQILPPRLLEQVRQYAEGRLLYVPTAAKTASLWGEGTGQRSYYRKRNQMLRNKYAYGVSVSQLADEYCLSQETVKKIVYNKKEKEKLPFSPHVASAEQYGRAGLGCWRNGYTPICCTGAETRNFRMGYIDIPDSIWAL